MKITTWLKQHNIPDETIAVLIPELRGDPFELETPERVMNSDQWFYFPDQTRFVIIGHCPNGDGIAIDTEKNKGSICYIAAELVQQNIPVQEKFVYVATSLNEYLEIRYNEGFPADFWEAKEK